MAHVRHQWRQHISLGQVGQQKRWKTLKCYAQPEVFVKLETRGKRWSTCHLAGRQVDRVVLVEWMRTRPTSDWAKGDSFPFPQRPFIIAWTWPLGGRCRLSSHVRFKKIIHISQILFLKKPLSKKAGVYCNYCPANDGCLSATRTMR
jgi:hypothetical protein